MLLAQLSTLTVSRYLVPRWKAIPNTSIQNKPLLVYHQVFENPSATKIESHLRSVGVVEPQWRYTMYSESHFHSSSHEFLCITSGSAKCCFGHEENPDRVELILSKGDAVAVPAGVSHCLLQDYGGFQMVGSYPVGKEWDMCYGRLGEEDQVQGITALDWFDRDPIYGDRGPCLEV